MRDRDFAGLRCRGGGRLVPADGHLPTAPWEFDADPACYVVGCNRLRCGSCGQLVQVRGPWRLLRGDIEWPTAHADPAWPTGTTGGVEHDPTVRLYICACQGWVADRVRAPELSMDWEPFLGEEAPPWSCDGHPPVTLPWAVDGVVWGDPEGAAALTRQALEGALASVPRFLQAEPSAWLVRCERLLGHTKLAGVIRRVCANSLGDPDAKVRARAADLLRFRADTAEAGEAAKALRGHPSLWGGRSDPFAPSCPASARLQDTVATRLTAGCATDEERDAVRACVDDWLTPNDRLARALVASDAQWFAPRIPRIFERSPSSDLVFTLVAAGRERDDAAIDAALLALAPRAGPALATAVRGLMRGDRRVRLLSALGS
jgi:hypothetical protein